MPVQYMTDPQLDAYLTSNGNLDPSVRQAVLDQLNADGVFGLPSNPALTAVVQTGTNGSLDADSGGYGCRNAATTPATKTGDRIWISSSSASPSTQSLTVLGSTNVFVATGHGNNAIILNDTGDDTVMAGSGNDTLTAGAGEETVLPGRHRRGQPHRRLGR